MKLVNGGEWPAVEQMDSVKCAREWSSANRTLPQAGSAT
jgi:hypothetical protein